MNNNGKKESPDNYYVCPVCKLPPSPMINGLLCQQCGVMYPVKNGIPVFLLYILAKSDKPVVRSVSFFDKLANMY